MKSQIFGLTLLAVWITPLASIIYASVIRTSYWVALRVCAAWAFALVACMVFNFWVADLLALSVRSSGYVRGKAVIGPYGFFVTVLLLVEIFAIVMISGRLRNRTTAKAKDAVPESAIREKVASSISTLSTPLDEKKTLGRPYVNAFRASGSALMFVAFSAANFFLAIQALQHSLFGLVFIVIAVGLLVAAYNASVERRSR